MVGALLLSYDYSALHAVIRALIGRCRTWHTHDRHDQILAFWEGYHESRRCSRDTYTEAYILVDEDKTPQKVSHFFSSLVGRPAVVVRPLVLNLVCIITNIKNKLTNLCGN